MGVNFLVPMWLPLNRPARTDACMYARCTQEYIYCDECGEKVIRITHKALIIINPDTIARVGFSHISDHVEYEHECSRKRA